ncbi:unnamed protein product [Fusarium graminearum]|nr:unnamed protein product [Fusarium graminearum]
MSDPVHPFSLTNGTGDIRFTLPGSNQEWTTRIQRPGEEQVNNNPSNNTPMERQAGRRPQHDMLPQQHAPQGSGRVPPGHQMAFTEHLRRGQEMTPLGVPRHVIDNADSEMMESLLVTPRRPKWESTMAADMEALGLNTPERQRRGQEMTPLGVPRHMSEEGGKENEIGRGCDA